MICVSSNYRYQDKVKIVKGFYAGYKGILEDYDNSKNLVFVKLKLSLDKSHYTWVHELEIMNISDEVYESEG